MNLLEGQKILAEENPKRRSMFMVRGGENEPYQFMVNTVLKDSKPPVHAHKVDESFMVLEGEFRFMVFEDMSNNPTKVFTMHPGDGHFVEAGIYHTFECDSAFGRIMEFKNEFYNPENDKKIAPIGFNNGRV